VVGRLLHGAELEIGLAGGERVAVEQNFLRPAATRFAAYDRMLAAFAIAREIRKGTVRARHRGVVLLDAALHLGEQLVL
jgi:hypothetical protein